MMTVASYAERLRAQMEEMERSGRFQLKYEIEPPATEADLDELAELIAGKEGMEGFRIEGAVREFYRAVDGLQWSWSFKGSHPGMPVMAGNANVINSTELYLPDEIIGQPYSLYGDYRLFDWLGTHWHVAARFERGQAEPRLYYRDESEEYFELSLDFNTYLETLLQVRALFPWQEFFVVDPRFNFNLESGIAFVARLELLFPEVDSSPFRKRLEGAGV